MAHEIIDNAVVKGCIRRMLQPVVRLCFRRSLQLNDIIDLLKEVFVALAKEELQKAGEAPSLSRLSVMTGVHRKDVTRIERAGDVKGGGANLIARVMVQWQHDPRFSTKRGRPRVITVEGRESEFAELVRSVNGEDVSPYAVLHEMERLGAVERTPNGLRLAWRDFVAGDDLRSGLEMLASDTADLGQAVEENLFKASESIRNLHLKTEFDNIVPEAVSEIRAWILQEGSLFHRRVRDFLARYDRDLSPSLKGAEGRCRVVLGTFSLTSSTGLTN
ncbi:MAG: hypothetical protein RL417_1853 [Pseudomonadota bacterium]|jgi:hypothetical protein